MINFCLDERDPTGDAESFHASMWDEERLRRQQIHFDFADESDEEVFKISFQTYLEYFFVFQL